MNQFYSPLQRPVFLEFIVDQALKLLSRRALEGKNGWSCQVSCGQVLTLERQRNLFISAQEYANQPIEEY